MTRKLITLLHVGKSALKWNDETYRDVLHRLTGNTSSTCCSEPQLERVVAYMKEQGFEPKPSHKHGRRPSVGGGKKAILAKIEALLAEANRKWPYAESLGKRMFGKERLEWLTLVEMTAVMNALQYDAKRHGRPV